MKFILAFIFGLLIINVNGQSCLSQYNTSLQGTSLNFDYTGDTARSITRLIFDQGENNLYGIAEGLTPVSSNLTMIFKSDLNLNFLWAMAYNNTMPANRGIEIDSTDTYLYFTLEASD